MATRDCCQPGGQARIIASVTCSLSTVNPPPVIKSLGCVCGDEQDSHHRHAAHRRHSQGQEPNIKYQRMMSYCLNLVQRNERDTTKNPVHDPSRKAWPYTWLESNCRRFGLCGTVPCMYRNVVMLWE